MKLSPLFALALSAGMFVTQNPKAWANTQTSTKSTKKTTMQKILSNTQAMYWSMLNGPGPGNNSVFSAVSPSGAQTRMNLFHMTWLGAKVSKDHTVGLQQRFWQEFGNSQRNVFQTLNPRAYWRASNVIDNKRINLLHEVRLELPTTVADRNNGFVTLSQLIQNFTIKTSNKKWYLGLSFFEIPTFFNNSTTNHITLVTLPNVSYTLNEKWSIYAWMWMDTQTEMNGNFFGRFQGIGSNTSLPGTASPDYLRVGPMYTVNSHFQVYPCVQMFLFEKQLSTVSLGLELSASL